MEEYHLKHFSHDHPLIGIFEVDDHEDPKTHLCCICGLPILSSPYYTCSYHHCNFFLHKPCALELPQTLTHHSHARVSYFRQHTLRLVPSSSPKHLYTYKCEQYCNFYLHPLVAKPLEIKSKHKSHQRHPIVAFCREILSQCDACGEEHKGFFFCCKECNFWIHQECTVLPTIVKLPSHDPHHLFFITYSLPSYILQGERCLFCNTAPHLRDSGVYFCGECNSLAHLRCAKKSCGGNLKSETSLELITLPDECDKFPNLVMSKYLERNPFTQDDDDVEHCIKRLLISDDNDDEISISRSEASCDNLACDICTRPIAISSPFYRCKQPLLSADFRAHDCCAIHLRQSKFSFGLKALLCPAPSNLVFNSVFPCFYCRRPCNGFCYYLDDISHSYFVDVECFAAPRTIMHESHRQHVLFQATRRLSGMPEASVPLSCCAGESLCFDVYRCIDCEFYIHIRCALLPKRAHHKFDEHPLELITTSRDNGDDDRKSSRFCEFCEEDIDGRYWCYGCGKCEQYFHIGCIPSVGNLSKVMLEKATFVDESIHPQHTLSLTQMLTVGRYERCVYCKQIIKCCVDEMAFHCFQCDFWIHFSCARDCAHAARKTATQRKLKVYSEVEKDYFMMFLEDNGVQERKLYFLPRKP